MHNLRGKIDSKMKYKWCCQCGEVGEGTDEYFSHIENHNEAEMEIKKKSKEKQ